ncbi:hypothetical protein [Cohnella hongkongensis]|uniref:DUF2140 family protein n=1 Tax=Cohnella hongkongensis TaxID=178337 RepID=A0ABV9FHZ3_9BACL
MKKLLIGLFVLVLLAALAGAGALYYVKPDQALDLAYEEVPLERRAIDMARRMSLELVLTAEDLSNLAKKSIADNPEVEKDVVVTGAEFALEGDRLIADLNILWKDWVSASVQVTYRLRWEDPNLIASVLEAKMKDVPLPEAMLSSQVIPIAQELPKPLKIESIKWEQGGVQVTFRKPSLSDLQQLIGQ